MTGPGVSLFEFVRHWSRRPPEVAERGRLVALVEAVEALERGGSPATITALAREIGIDQSGASRLVRAAADAGHLDLTPADHDGRVRVVRLRESGRGLLAAAHAWQEEVFDRLTADWGAERRREFQRSMTELVDRSLRE